MYNPVQLAVKFVQYYVKALNGKGHGIHSPFVFDFVKNVLNDERKFYSFEAIEKQRSQLLSNPTIVTVEDFGAGSRKGLTKQRKIKDIAASSLKPKKFAQLLFKMVNYYQPKTIVELGTSLGITSCYLASANNKATLITMEGSNAIANIAKHNFEHLQLQNIKTVIGNFDETLKPTLSTIDIIDFAFIDGNHRYQPTIQYFENILPKLNENSVVVLDDVHWSKEMEQAWNEIKQHHAVTLSIDLFFIGIVFFRKDFKEKQNFVVRY